MTPHSEHAWKGRRHLYLQIYFTVLASLVLVVAAMAAIWHLVLEDGLATPALEMAGEVAAATLPAADAPRQAQRDALERLSARLKADLALYDAEGALVASAIPSGSGALPGPQAHRRGWWRHGWSLQFSDGRSLVVRLSPEHPSRFAWLGFLALVALAVAVAAYPLVRRLTRRLERLQSSVDALGEGDLAARVPVHGHDEVAQLAVSFNRAAARIEALVGSHRMLLANTSHELRTPLARIRMAVELMKEGADAARKAELERDIAELDALIDEVLLASRLDAVPGLPAREPVDLLALGAEECARYEHCQLEGEPVTVRGDPRLLRRMIRNLLENATRHAGGSAIEVSIAASAAEAELRIRDHGPGIRAEERERVFEPFYRSKERLPASGGTGLGLALVRQIARRHGGDAACLDVPDAEGALFVVRLPLEKS